MDSIKNILLASFFGFGIVFGYCDVMAQSNALSFSWDTIQELPLKKYGEPNPGVAGAFVGMHNDVLIIAGGANFPDGGIWKGGNKVYHDKIYVLQKNEDQYEWIEQIADSLSTPIAYGLSVSTKHGILCVGGMNEMQTIDDVFLIKWEDSTILMSDVPDLPTPMANMSGAVIGDFVYVAGVSEGLEKTFVRINVNSLNSGWESLPLWNGSPRTHAIGVAQNNGDETCFYLIKGRINKKDQKPSTLLPDSWMYVPSQNIWKEVAVGNEMTLAAGTGIAAGANHVLLFGGDDGIIFNRLERLNIEISSTTDEVERANLKALRDSIMMNHHGFSRNIWSFHTITQTMTLLDSLPFNTPVTTTPVKWGEVIILPSGEVSPCIRTPSIMQLKLDNTIEFGRMNYIVVACYLFALIILGFYFTKRQKTTDDFFKAGKRIPAWAAGLSIFGTQLSAITFMAIPAKTFATDWLYFFLMMTIIMIIPFIIHLFLPFYRRFNLTTAYQYLELRFNLLTRLAGSLMYILLQIGRLGIVLLLPALALSVVTGIDVYLCILAMGILSIVYTVLGGIEAVIWTDVLQVIVLLGGALFSLGILFLSVDAIEIRESISSFRKMRIFDTTFSFSHPTLWVVLIGGLASNLIQYGSDQTVVQRYLTTKNEAAAARSIRIGAWMALPSSLIFFTLGTLLFVYYKVHPELMNPIMEKTDAIFPWFIVNGLPNGISGVLIAAIFAASMSSLDSSMNSVATVITTDFFQRFKLVKDNKRYLGIARWITVVIGVIGTALALVMAAWGISSLWDQFNMIIGLFAGGLGGVFLLGIFFKKANGMGAFIGLLTSGLIQFSVKEFTDIHLLMYAFTGMVSAIVLGYLFSFLFNNPNSDQLQYTFTQLNKQNG